MKTGIKFVLIMILAALPLTALAQDSILKVTPGKYQIKRKTAPDNDANAVEKTEEKCIMDPVFKPESVLPPQGNCKANNVKKDGNSVTFDIDCAGGPQMPPLTAKAEYSSNGMAIGWHIVFTFKDQNSGQPLTIIDSAEGKRIGDCPK
ncbi:MAG TPA: DUF3617 family protein [Thermodesulfobacteriota bacterium]|nr:DUF3617 family protein [Thermodesulfobacteriota bacterium]